MLSSYSSKYSSDVRQFPLVIALHFAGGFPRHLLAGMSVQGQRDSGRAVAEERLNAFHVSTVRNGDSGGGVAQIMHAEVRSADAGGDPLDTNLNLV